MLSPEEEKFLVYWEAERVQKKSFVKRFSIGLPLLALASLAFFANFVSGWYGKADKELRRHSSLLIVILVAVIAIVIFVAVFSARHRWEQAEADYQALLQKRTSGTIN